MGGETGYLFSLKISPCKIVTDYKKKKCNFLLEKPGTGHLNQVIKVHTAHSGTYQCHYCAFLPKMHKLSITLKKHWTISHWDTFEKWNALYIIFKNVKGVKVKEKPRNYSCWRWEWHDHWVQGTISGWVQLW